MILIGVGNMLSDIYDCASLLNKRVTALVLNVPERNRPRTKDLNARLRELGEQPVIMTLEQFAPQQGEEYFLVPATSDKAELAEYLERRHQVRFCSLVHPTAFVSRHARIGQGVFIGAGSIIAPGCDLRDHVNVNRGVTVGHDVVLHEFVRLNPGCNVAGHVEIGRGAVVGIGANIIEELVIGSHAVVAAGAAVLQDVPERALVAGVPAVVKKIYGEPTDARGASRDGHSGMRRQEA